MGKVALMRSWAGIVSNKFLIEKGIISIECPSIVGIFNSVLPPKLNKKVEKLKLKDNLSN